MPHIDRQCMSEILMRTPERELYSRPRLEAITKYNLYLATVLLPRWGSLALREVLRSITNGPY
eukprot:scaffold170100_cov50-Prasinocladus_malaysianus.AAC.1